MNHFLQVFSLAFLAGSFSLSSCSPGSESLINTAHLDHLYEEITVDGATLGAVWIYCEAPDYHLVADDDEGFTCVDDVARALVFYCRQYASAPTPEVAEKIRAMTEFLLYMQADNGYFYNFLLPGPKINRTHQNSRAVANWWSWRAFWALSEVHLLDAETLADLQDRIRPVLDVLVDKMQNLCPPQDTGFAIFDLLPVPECLVNDLGADQIGVMMTGLANYYRIDPAEPVRNLLLYLGDLLLQIQHGDADTWPHGVFLSWRNLWHAWGNAQASGLLYAGRVLQHKPFIEAGLEEARFFYPYFLEQGGLHAFWVENQVDSLVARDLQAFPQIAYNIRPMVYASLEAYAVTGDTSFVETAARLTAWLFGDNPTGKRMYDPKTGRTFDGIASPAEVNRNSGAESTIEALLTLQALEAVPEAKATLEHYLAKTAK